MSPPRSVTNLVTFECNKRAVVTTSNEKRQTSQNCLSEKGPQVKPFFPQVFSHVDTRSLPIHWIWMFLFLCIWSLFSLLPLFIRCCCHCKKARKSNRFHPSLQSCWCLVTPHPPDLNVFVPASFILTLSATTLDLASLLLPPATTALNLVSLPLPPLNSIQFNSIWLVKVTVLCEQINHSVISFGAWLCMWVTFGVIFVLFITHQINAVLFALKLFSAWSCTWVTLDVILVLFVTHQINSVLIAFGAVWNHSVILFWSTVTHVSNICHDICSICHSPNQCCFVCFETFQRLAMHVSITWHNSCSILNSQNQYRFHRFESNLVHGYTHEYHLTCILVDSHSPKQCRFNPIQFNP